MTPTITMFYGISILLAAIAFAFAAYLYVWVKHQPQENKRITEVAGLIRDGANTFMKREYKILAIFASVIAILILVFLPHPIGAMRTGGKTLLWRFPTSVVRFSPQSQVSSVSWSQAFPTADPQRLLKKVSNPHF